MAFLLALLVTATIFLVLMAVFTALGRDKKDDRLKAVKNVNKKSVKEEKKEKKSLKLKFAQKEKKKKPQSLKKREKSSKQIEETDNMLEMAGYDITAEQFSVIKVMIAIFVAILTFLICSLLKAPMKITALSSAILALIGLRAPVFIVRKMVTARKERMRNQLPDIMDLLVVSVEAGLGFDAALLRLYEKNKSEMMTELIQATKDIQRGMSKKEAYDSLAKRCDFKELSSFLSALVQADQLGISIKSVLTTQSDALRLERKQRAEEKALKAPVVMMLPMVMFIFPVIFIVLLGPAVMNIMDAF